MKVQLDKFSSNMWSVSGELISSIFVLKNVLRSAFQWPLGTKIIFPSPQSVIPLTSNCFCYFFDWVSMSDIYSGIGNQYHIGPNFWDWVVTEILAAHTPV